MIDFRYHVVSIIAVFLALGLGVVAGTTVLDRVTVGALEGRVDDLRQRLNEHRKEITELRAERDQANDLVKALAPRVMTNLLSGSQVVFVTGAETADWQATVRDALTNAGASVAGSIALESKWTRTPEERDQLRAAFGDQKLDPEDPGPDAARLLGELIADPAEASIVSNLADAGFARVTSPGRGLFPQPGVQVVVFTSTDDKRLGLFARGASSVTPTLAVAASMDKLGPVADLRKIEDPPKQLATFDSAARDPTGIGAVLAFRAAIDGRGGHFGRGPGLRFVPAPA